MSDMNNEIETTTNKPSRTRRVLGGAGKVLSVGTRDLRRGALVGVAVGLIRIGLTTLARRRKPATAPMSAD